MLCLGWQLSPMNLGGSGRTVLEPAVKANEAGTDDRQLRKVKKLRALAVSLGELRGLSRSSYCPFENPPTRNRQWLNPRKSTPHSIDKAKEIGRPLSEPTMTRSVPPLSEIPYLHSSYRANARRSHLKPDHASIRSSSCTIIHPTFRLRMFLF